MTTIVYSNGYIAADTRTTFPKHADLRHTVCLGCGESHDEIADNTSKIWVPEKSIKWRDDTIVAVAGAGNKAQIDKAFAMMKAGANLIAKVDVLREFNEVRNHCSYGLIIVTDNKVIIYRPNHYKKEYEKVYTLDDDVAIGSGEDVARFTLKAFGCSVYDAVTAAAFVDPGTGGEVNWVDCREGADRTVGTASILTKEEFTAKMRASNPFPL